MRRVVSGLVLLCACVMAQGAMAQIRPGSNTQASALIGRAVTARIGNAPVAITDIVRDDLQSALGRLARFASTPYAEPALVTRGGADAAIYREISPSVVMIVTETGIGSGSLISASGDILTNWHVVENAESVAVVFKPEVEGQEPSRNEMRRGRIVRVDKLADLALVRVEMPPAGRVPVLFDSMNNVSVGSDVHAIGHPEGQSWTYTKGIISQIRRSYNWTYADKTEHRGDVIQTQTPINPGNSGGPLISEKGMLIGVNSFGGQGQGLNFAVSVDEVARFLMRTENQEAPPQTGAKCDTLVEKGRSDDNKASYEAYDLACEGKTTGVFWIPDDKSEPTELQLDLNSDGIVEGVIYDEGRDDKWDISFWDKNFDGNYDIVGYHPDGDLEPSEFESVATYEKRFAKK